jgi:hypothetical protein
MRQLTRPSAGAVRMSVVLDPRLAEYVRVRAFQTRKSRSAYVRDLVVADAAARSTQIEQEAR